MSNAPTLTAQYIGFVSIPTPPTPPGGVIYTYMDSTGALKQVNDQGVVSAFGGGGGLTPIANNTVLGNISGASANPTGLTATQIATLLSTPTNETITAGSNLTDLTIAPTGWTLNGDTDGSYHFEGVINFAAGSSGTNFSFAPNGDTGNAESNELIFGSVNALAGVTPLTYLPIGAGSTFAGTLSFRADLTAKSGSRRLWTCTSWRHDGSTTLMIMQQGVYTATATVIGPTSTIHSSAASGIQTGSFVNVSRSLRVN